MIKIPKHSRSHDHRGYHHGQRSHNSHSSCNDHWSISFEGVWLTFKNEIHCDDGRQKQYDKIEVGIILPYTIIDLEPEYFKQHEEGMWVLGSVRLAEDLGKVHITQVGFNRLKSVAWITVTEYVNDGVTLEKPF